MTFSGCEFNSMAEKFYRGELKNRQIAEGIQMLRKDLAKLDSWEFGATGNTTKCYGVS
jgi:hypothetical protein